MKSCEDGTTAVRKAGPLPKPISVRDDDALVQLLSVATPNGWSHVRQSISFLRGSTFDCSRSPIVRSARPTESEKVVHQSTIIRAIKAHGAVKRMLKGVSGGLRVQSTFLISGLLLDRLGFDGLVFDSAAEFGFEVVKDFVVVRIDVRCGPSIILELALLAITRTSGRRCLATRRGTRSVADTGSSGATALALVDAVGLHHAFVALGTSECGQLEVAVGERRPRGGGVSGFCGWREELKLMKSETLTGQQGELEVCKRREFASEKTYAAPLLTMLHSLATSVKST